MGGNCDDEILEDLAAKPEDLFNSEHTVSQPSFRGEGENQGLSQSHTGEDSHPSLSQATGYLP